MKKDRIIENIDVFDFELSVQDIAQIATLDEHSSAFFDHRDPEMVKWIAGLKHNN